MQGIKFYFCPTLKAYFAWVLSLSEVGLRSGGRGEKGCECYPTDSTHTHTPAPGLLKGLQTPASISGCKDSLVIRNQFDQCWKRPGWTQHPIWTLQRQKLTDLKLVYRAELISSFHLAINKHHSSLVKKDFHIVTAATANCLSWCLDLFPSFELFTTKGRELLSFCQPQLCSSKMIYIVKSLHNWGVDSQVYNFTVIRRPHLCPGYSQLCQKHGTTFSKDGD